MTREPVTMLTTTELQGLIHLKAHMYRGSHRWDRRYVRKMWQTYLDRGVLTMTQYLKLRKLMQDAR